MHLTTMLFVEDVEATSRWYQDLFDLRSAHGGAEFEMLNDGDHTVLQLHHLEAGEHVAARMGDAASNGTGTLLFLHVEDVDATFERARSLGCDLVDEPHDNEIAGMREFSLRDPNGFPVTVCRSRWA